MTQLPERVRSAVLPHIPDGESVRAARSVHDENDERTEFSTIVTDRRVLDVKAHQGDTKVDIDVSSYSLADDRIFGVEYDENASSSISPLKILAILAGVLGILLFFAGLSEDAGSGGVIVFGLMLLAGAALAWYLASDSVSGDVRVEVQSTASSKEWEFPRGATDVPQAISRVTMEHQVALVERKGRETAEIDASSGA